MLALKGDSSSPSTTLRTGMVISVPASVALLGRVALCCGVAGNPGGDLGDCAAAGGAAEACGGVQGVGADGAEPVIVAGSPGRAKSKFKYADPLKIFVLIYKKILINKIFHFEASYYLSQHGSHLHLTAPYSYLTDSNFWTCRSYKRM